MLFQQISLISLDVEVCSEFLSGTANKFEIRNENLMLSTGHSGKVSQVEAFCFPLQWDCGFG